MKAFTGGIDLRIARFIGKFIINSGGGVLILIVFLLLGCGPDITVEEEKEESVDIQRYYADSKPYTRWWWFAGVILAIIASAAISHHANAPAQAQISCSVVYDQPVLAQGDRGPFSEFESGGNSQQIADQFVVTESLVSNVSWAGSYFSSNLPENSDQIDFRVRFFQDRSAGVPQSSPLFDELVTAQVTDSGVDQ
ncbi:MAG: hypothetical protein IH795_02230, partial [Bacteroidetes bacterium]|nr:hypothetical protein [Bacteroidota bacterium]